MSLSSTQLTAAYGIVNGGASPNSATLTTLEALDSVNGDAATIETIAQNSSPAPGQPGGVADPNAYITAQVIELCTGGTPTETQLVNWTHALDSGTSLQSFTDTWIASDLTAAHYGLSSDLNPSDLCTVVAQVVQNATGVAATQNQINVWSQYSNETVFSEFGVGDQVTAQDAPHIADFFIAGINSMVNSTAWPSGDLLTF